MAHDARDGLLFHHKAPCKDCKYAEEEEEEYVMQGFHKFVNVAYLFGLFFLDNLFKIKTVSWCCGQV